MGYRELSPELLARAQKELNEDPKRRDQDIQHIKDWLKKQPHIKARMDDQWLLTFLRGCKFSLERTKEKLDMYYTVRRHLPELFADRDPFSADIQKILSAGVLTKLPQTDAQGRRVILMNVGKLPAGTVSAEAAFRTNFLGLDISLLEDDEAIICGQVVIQDMKDITLGHMTAITPYFMKRVATCFQEAYPLRPKGTHVINVPPGVEKFISLFQSFMKEKLRRRVFIHSSMETLYEHIPKKILPQEYGGEAGPIEEMQNAWKAKVESYSSFFKEDAQYGVDESKRPGKPKTMTDLFGLEGSFRQLSLD
ncbi:alpha-tocopherol transfer protein-like [Schistocerca nitens]|uniref:alpha-tocopherol transfer protein-like n=1 Tax=Schistocerca nitens TaxID=7011 RepID=UPI0021199B1D|nr:alpha-tocopherol transfer protein-like [Schistocerca nitens]